MQDRDNACQAHHHFHVVLDDEDREIPRDTSDQFHGCVGLSDAHPCGGLVEAEEFGFCR